MVKFLTTEEHQEVVRRLTSLAQHSKGTCIHTEGWEYTSIMVCFLMHQVTSAQSLLKLLQSFKSDWFPVTPGYVIVRSMFEVDVTAHYVAIERGKRSQRYIEYGHILEKRQLDARAKHRESTDASWREGMISEWQHYWASREKEINAKFESVRHRFERVTKKGKPKQFQNWSGKSLREMATEVNHEEAYDVFYADLSSYAHGDVRLADQFLRQKDTGPSWSVRAREGEVGSGFRYAAIFLSCFLSLFGKEFGTWTERDVRDCWNLSRV
jgi:hypothetical protein